MRFGSAPAHSGRKSGVTAMKCPLQELSVLLHGLCADPRTGSLPAHILHGSGPGPPEEVEEDNLGTITPMNTRDTSYSDMTAGYEYDDEDPYHVPETAKDRVDTEGTMGRDVAGNDIRDWALEMLSRTQVGIASSGNASSSSTTLVDSDAGLDALFDTEDPDEKVELPIDPVAAANQKLRPKEHVDPAERLRRIEEEFGPWKGPGEEQFIEQLPATLYRNVLVKGALALTNKRLVYLAYLPRFERGKVLKSGFVTVHISGIGPFSRKLRRWSELRSDSLTCFRDSSSLYKPIMSISLSAIRSISAMDDKNSRSIRFHFTDGYTCEVTLDTAEAAWEWHKEWVGALYAFRAKSDRLRASIPLRRIQSMSSYISEGLARAMDLKVETEQSLCRITSIVEGEEATARDVTFAYLVSLYEPFYERLGDAVEIAKSDPEQQDLAKVPEPMLEIGHCDQAEPSGPEGRKSDPGHEDVDLPEMAKRFVKTFVLQCDPSDLFVTRCQYIRTLPLYGTLAVGGKYLAYWRRNVLSRDLKIRIPMTDIESVRPARAFGFHVWGLAIQVVGAPDVRLDFHSHKDRDATIDAIRKAIEHYHPDRADSDLGAIETMITRSSVSDSPVNTPGGSGAQTPARQDSVFTKGTSTTHAEEEEKKRSMPLGQPLKMGRMTMPVGSKLIAKLVSTGNCEVTIPPKHFVLLTIGSRGDVQVYISLAKRLQEHGHRVTIASHPEYRKWVEGFNIGYRAVGGDPAALMKLAVEHPVLSPGFFRESVGHFRTWLDNLFEESWIACKDAEILVESPSTFAGIHIAEALKIPYFRAFTMPWTRTASYPQAMASSSDVGPSYNLMSYTLFENLIWTAMSGQINRWRKHMLHLPPTTLDKLRPATTPFIYNFSNAVVPRPNDWKDHIAISGYWFLDTKTDYKPPEDLVAFIEKAKADGVPLIYVGFGSITVPDAAATTAAIYEAVESAGVRAIVAKGWSDRGNSTPSEQPTKPDCVYCVDSIPHDWLFPQVDAACHHGGAGTVAASLRFGVPTLVCPFFGDQFFWGNRVTKLGCGLKVDSLSASDLSAAFKKATKDRLMKEKAEKIGAKIRSEDGPETAIQFMYTHYNLSLTRVLERAERTARKPTKSGSKSSVSTSSTRKPSNLSSIISDLPPDSDSEAPTLTASPVLVPSDSPTKMSPVLSPLSVGRPAVPTASA